MLSSWAGLCPPQGHTQSRQSKASNTLTSQSAGRRRRRPDAAPSSPHRQGCCAEAPRKLGGKTKASRCPQHLCLAWTLEAAGTWRVSRPPSRSPGFLVRGEPCPPHLYQVSNSNCLNLSSKSFFILGSTTYWLCGFGKFN